MFEVILTKNGKILYRGKNLDFALMVLQVCWEEEIDADMLIG